MTGSEHGEGQSKVPPPEVREGVIRWLRSRVEAKGRPRRTDLDRHPDWPMYVRWAREYPADDPDIRRLQRESIELDDAVRTRPVAMAIGFLIFRAITVLFPRRDESVAPGEWLRRVGRFVLGEKRAELMVEAALAEMHAEYFEAKAAGKIWHARMAVLRGYFLALRPFAEPLIAALRALWKLFGP
jgi:hypothetical protein